MDIFQRRESEVRTYCRSFPVIFQKAKGAFLYDEQGKKYIDFFCGAGSLNYGHNKDTMKQAIIDYLNADSVTHSLDMATIAKKRFLEEFESVILQPRELNYKIQFTGPTGTNANEAALKLARIVKKRSNVIAFTNGFHGLSSGSLSVTSNAYYRNELSTARLNVSFMPYDGYLGENVNTIEYLRKFLDDKSSGIDLPAAIIVETLQAEGGVNVASSQWLRDLDQLCKDFDILLIVDDIQVGVGRTGSFFSFERAGIKPDIVTLSKSISGFGLPMSLVLMKPELDKWKPGEHSGTFRGNNLAFVTATEALNYWKTEEFSESTNKKGEIIEKKLSDIKEKYPVFGIKVRGLGMLYGLEVADPEISASIVKEAFERGVIIELCGVKKNVLKFLPPLTIDKNTLKEGLAIINQCFEEYYKRGISMYLGTRERYQRAEYS